MLLSARSFALLLDLGFLLCRRFLAVWREPPGRLGDQRRLSAYSHCLIVVNLLAFSLLLWPDRAAPMHRLCQLYIVLRRLKVVCGNLLEMLVSFFNDLVYALVNRLLFYFRRL